MTKLDYELFVRRFNFPSISYFLTLTSFLMTHYPVLVTALYRFTPLIETPSMK